MKTKLTNLIFGIMLPLALAAPLSAGIVVRAGSTREPQHMDPARSWDDMSSFYITNIFDTLVRFDPRTMKIEPALATDWKTSRDGRTWNFNLRRGVRFHDGTPCDAEAVVFTFARQMDPANPRRASEFPLFQEIFTHLQAVRKLAPYQVQFVLAEPFYPFLSSLTSDCAAIVSPAAVQKNGAAFDRQPVGTGPFKLVSWQKGKRLTLAANNDYWRGRPAIEKYIDTIEPQNDLLIKYFRDGLLDILTTYSISKMINYRKQDWVAIAAAPIFSVTYLVVNAARPQLQNRDVRLALGRAWDQRALKLVFQDYVLPINSLLPPELAGGADQGRSNDFSLAKARALLHKGGAAGLLLEIPVLKSDTLIFRLLTLYASNLKQIGVKLKLTRLHHEALAARLARGDFDLAYTGWIADYPNSDCMLSPLFSEKLRQQGLANIAASAGAELPERLDRARREGDKKKRLADYRALDRAISDTGMVIPLFQDKMIVTFNRRLGDIQPNPLGRFFLYEIRTK